MHPLLRFTCVLAATLVAAAPVSAQESTSGDGVDLASIEAWSDAGAPDAPTADSPSAIFSYHHILGSALRPRSSSSTFAYGGNGCIYVTGGSEIRFQFPVTLPEGSEIRYVRIYYNDAATQNVTVWPVLHGLGLGFVHRQWGLRNGALSSAQRDRRQLRQLHRGLRLGYDRQHATDLWRPDQLLGTLKGKEPKR
jgi:hypothetical protein